MMVLVVHGTLVFRDGLTPRPKGYIPPGFLLHVPAEADCKDSTSGSYTLSLRLRGSKYPIFKDSGVKNHALNGFWDQKP